MTSASTEPTEPAPPSSAEEPVAAGAGIERRVHAYADDVLGELDATGVATAIAAGEITAYDAVDAAVRRLEAVEPRLHALVATMYGPAYQQASELDARPTAERPSGRRHPFVGVPTLLKDNVDLEGHPTQHGSRAFTSGPLGSSERFTEQFLDTGVVVLAKSTLPEFGFSASTESVHGDTHNPWHRGHTPGGSSGGSAAMVAAGAVPMAHGNDGAGSIRIPAACCGLVGMKTTRGREATARAATMMPVNIVCNGVITRSVRDTAAWVASLDGRQHDRSLPDVGLVDRPGDRRRIGLVIDAPGAEPTADDTRAVVERTAALLEDLGHTVVPIAPPVDAEFGEHFLTYWATLSAAVQHAGLVVTGHRFDSRATEQLTHTLAGEMRQRWRQVPGAVLALRRSQRTYAKTFEEVDVVLSPTLSHAAPPLGFLGADQPPQQQLERLVQWVTFTPVNNAAGSPGISLPMGSSAAGIPIGVHLSGAHGDDRTLLELAVELEEAQPFARIQDA